MTPYSPAQLRRFLKAVDAQLHAPYEIIVIGGAAACLSLGSTRHTADIDTATPVDAIRDACTAARAKSGLRIPLAFATVFEAPREFRRRLRRLRIAGLRHLRVRVPEKHDWAIMKMSRFEEKDRLDLKAAKTRNRLSKETLLQRFRSEMKSGDRLTLHFLAMIEELWGSADADRMQAALRRR